MGVYVDTVRYVRPGKIVLVPAKKWSGWTMTNDLSAVAAVRAEPPAASTQIPRALFRRIVGSQPSPVHRENLKAILAPLLGNPPHDAGHPPFRAARRRRR